MTKVFFKSYLVSCTGFNIGYICHILSFLEVQYFDSDDMMSPASIEMFTPTARGQCPMFAAGGEREACVSCQDPWDENNFEMRSYNVYNIIQHVTSSLVVTTRHERFSFDHPISIRIILFSHFSGTNT